MSLRYLLLAALLAAPAAAADDLPGEPPRAPTTALTLGERRVILVRPIDDAFVVPEAAVEVSRLGRQTLVLTPRKSGPAELRVVFEGREWSMPLRVSSGRFQAGPLAREERPVQDLKTEDFEEKKTAAAASPAPTSPRVRAAPAAPRDAERVIARVNTDDAPAASPAPTSPPSAPAADRAVQEAARERVKRAAHRAADEVIEQTAPATPKPLPPPATWGAFASQADLGAGALPPAANARPDDVRVWGDPDAQPEPEVPEAAEPPPPPAPRRMIAIPRPRDEDVPRGAVPLLSFRPPARAAPRGAVGSWHGARVLEEDEESDDEDEGPPPPSAKRVPEPAVIGPWSSMPPPVDDDARPPRLTGILRTAQGPVALLDGQPAGVGESAAGYTVDRVDPDRVVLTRGGKNIEIRINAR